jgi:aspartate aminotransferase
MPGVTFSRPRGAFYIIVGLPIPDGEDFARWMLEHFVLDGETTMVAPLQGFYVTPNYGASEVRIAFVLDEDRIGRAIRILGVGLDQYLRQPAMRAAS